MVHVPVKTLIYASLIAVLISFTNSFGAPPIAGAGTCLRFDGIINYVYIDEGFNTSTWTLEFWIKPNNTADDARIFIQGTAAMASRQIMAVWDNSDDQIEFKTSTTSTPGTADVASSTITDGVWTHIAWTSANNVYVNGVSSTGSVNIGKNYGMDGSTFIGCRAQTGNFFSGSIDEVRLWQPVKSQSDIQNNMYRSLTDTTSADMDGILYYYRLDEGSGTIARDYSDTSQLGTIVGATYETSEAWKNRQADEFTPLTYFAGYDDDKDPLTFSNVTPPTYGRLFFDHGNGEITYIPNFFYGSQTDNFTFRVTAGGQTSDYAMTISMSDINNPPTAGSGNALDFDGTDDFVAIPALNLNSNTVTISAWVKCNGAQSDQATVAMCRGGNTVVGLNIMSTGELRYHWDGNYWGWLSGLTVPIDQWTFVAAVIEPNQATLYVNSNSAVNTAVHNIEEFDTTLQIGRDKNFPNTRNFKGLIDELRIWSTARNAAQLASDMFTPLAGNEAGLAGYWRMDNYMTSMVRDHSTNRNHGLMINMTGADWVDAEMWSNRTCSGQFTHNAGYDPDGDAITIGVVSGPSNGSLSWDTNARTVTYTPNVSFSGIDTYTYRVSDGGSEDDFAMTVTVNQNAPPTFSTHPSPDTVAVNDPASFTAIADGSPTITYQWQTDTSGTWADISGAAGTTYNIALATLAHAGNYRSVATNGFGADTSDSAFLLVYDSSLIYSDPANDTVLAGGTAKFGVGASGSSLAYQWQRNDGGWHNITTGGTSDTLSFIAASGDDRVSFRCVVTSGPIYDTSGFAMLYIATIPTITVSFKSDTALPVGGNFTLTGSAFAFPDPGYEWFFIYPGSTPVSKGTGTTLSLTGAAKADSGIYYFVASNAFGSRSSDSIFVHVLTPASITTNLPQTYNVIHGGGAALNIAGSGDGAISYQWYESDTILPGQTNNSLKIDIVDSAVHNGNTYHCLMSNSYLSMTVGTARSVTCTLKISDFYNPFKVKAERIDIHNTTQVRIKLWSDVNISNFPTTEPFPGIPWADSVWVIYTSNNYPASILQPNVAFALYSTEEIKQAADTVVKTLTVAELIPGGLQPFPHNSNYYFSNSVKWHNPDTLLKDFVPGNPVFMLDTLAAPNLLVVHGKYFKRDTVKITIDSIPKLNASIDSLVVVQSSKLADFSSLMFTDTFSVPALIAGGSSHTYALIDTTDNFPLATVSGLDTFYCRWFTIGTNTAVSVKLDTAYTIGWPRPVYSGILTADSTFLGDQMHLQWTAPQAETDSIRIWWNVTPIPLVYNPSLPASQSHDTTPVVTVDTINGLSSQTLYYLALQIFKDEMWSVITAASSDTAMTAHGSFDTVANVISVDSTGFDTTRNSMLVYWHIDLTTAPPGMYYEAGYTYEPDSVLDTAGIKPASWAKVENSINMTEIVLHPDIVFDTVYAVGMWLRGYNPLQGGPTGPANPTDTSYVFVTIPSFTWQVVEFFIDTATHAYAANKKIILQKIYAITHKDTLRSFKPGSLPCGFAEVGSVPFRFSIKNPGIAPFDLGLKYDPVLPAGITESDLAMYRAVNGEFFILYGFKVENGAVWKTISSDSMAYPFIVLADTMAPEITVSAYNDTIVRGSNIPTWFTVNDNVANTHWKLVYGQGNEAYVKSEEGYLNKSFDTANLLLEYIDSSVINESFGVRVLLLAEDGIRSDTENVSRCVESTTGESFSMGSNEWVPLRTRMGLYERSLETIFDQSVAEPDPWEYDIYSFRIYRWYNTDTSADNGWLEYSDAVKGEFDFFPGRLIWCKAAEDQRIDFGQGVTTTLKEPYRMTLKPKNWTDITLPFQFPVKLRDVLAATTPYYDSLEVYYWKKDSLGYSAHDLYIYAFDVLDSVFDTLVSYQKYDGYTVYNHYQTPVTLLIPPTCLALSKPGTRHITKEHTEKGTESWDISFNWKDANAGESSFYKRVRCGYKNGEGKTIFGSLPPSMSKVQVGVLDNSGRYTCGWALKRVMEKKGGTTFEIVLDNKTKEAVDIEYYLDRLHVLPKGFKARVYDAKSGDYSECSADNAAMVTVESNGSVRRLIAIGPEDYFSSLFAAFMPMKLLKIYPNPFNGIIKIHYRIPLGIKEVQFSLYNVQGKLLWRGVKGKYLEAGENIFYLNSNSLGANRALPAGVYIMRLSAKNASGKTIYGGEKRITCIK